MTTVNTRELLKAAAAQYGGMAKMAMHLGVSRQALYLWSKIPAERLIEVERVTGVSRDVWRPDLYVRTTS